MQKSKRQILARYVIYAVEIILIYALERVVNVGLSFSGLYLFMTIPAFVSVVLFERENSGMIFGILAGMLIDYGHGNGIGGVAMFLCVFGYMLGLISNYILCANVFMGTLISTFLIMVVEGMKIFFSVNDVNLWFKFLGEYFWKDLLVAVPIFIVMFYFNRVVSYKLGGKEEVFD